MNHLFSIMPIEAFQDQRLTLRHLRVLGALMSFRSKNTNLVWPSRAEISKRCGFAETRISTITSELVDLGWLEKEGKGGYSKATRYRITVPNLVTVTDPEIGAETVTESVTVTKPVTVTKSVTGMGVTNLVTGKEHNQEQTNKPKPPLPPYVDGLNISAWDEYTEHRKEIRARTLKTASIKKQQAWLVRQGNHQHQQAIVDQTIRNNWTGLFELKEVSHETNRGSDTGTGKRSFIDRLQELPTR